MNKVFVFLADGFEEIEGLTVVDLLRRADIDTETVSIGDSTKVVGAHQIEIEADSVFCEGMEEEYLPSAYAFLSSSPNPSWSFRCRVPGMPPGSTNIVPSSSIPAYDHLEIGRACI